MDVVEKNSDLDSRNPSFIHLPIRIEKMTHDMIPAVIRIHLSVFQGYMNTRLGEQYLKNFFSWFHSYDKAITVVARNMDGAVVGYAIGAEEGYERQMSRDLIWCAAMNILLRPWLFFTSSIGNMVLNRFKIIFGPHKDIQSDSQASDGLPMKRMVLVGIGVIVSEQGKKIGQQLLAEFERQSQTLQKRMIVLTVYQTNQKARQFYERCHWQPSFNGGQNSKTITYFKILPEIK